MHENSDFLRLVVNSIRKDLDENNEINNCLALHAIANVGGTEMAEALCEDVHRLLISPYVGEAALRRPVVCPLTTKIGRPRAW
jgi:vesicle coat complex subunit